MLLVVSVAGYHYTMGPGLPARAVNEPSRSFTVPENARNWAFSLLKAPTSVYTPDEQRAGHCETSRRFIASSTGGCWAGSVRTWASFVALHNRHKNPATICAARRRPVLVPIILYPSEPQPPPGDWRNCEYELRRGQNILARPPSSLSNLLIVMEWLRGVDTMD